MQLPYSVCMNADFVLYKYCTLAASIVFPFDMSFMRHFLKGNEMSILEHCIGLFCCSQGLAFMHPQVMGTDIFEGQHIHGLFTLLLTHVSTDSDSEENIFCFNP